MDPILYDFLTQQLNDGKNAITQKDGEKLLAIISFIDAQIFNSQAILDDDSFRNIEVIVITQTRRIELLTNFKTLFQIYVTYLQQTNGAEDYFTWYNRVNVQYGGKTPKQYIENLQPVWYTTRDTDGDGQYDEIIPQFGPNGQSLLWSNSPMPSAILYREIRKSLSPLTSTTQTNPNSLANIDPTKLRNLGGCAQPKYSYRIRQNVDPLLPQQRQFYGYRINQQPRLLVTVFAACNNTPPTELFTITVDANIFWKLTENSEGNFVAKVKDSTERAIGIIKYGYYFNLQTLFEKVYAQMFEIKLAPTGQSVYDNIKYQLTSGILMFVDNFGPTMGSSPGLPRSDSFYKPGPPPSGFATTLPETFKTLRINNQVKWLDDVTDFNAMNVVENFFFMGGTEYGKIKYDDIKTTTTLTGEFGTGNDWNPSPPITPFINARLTGEVENKSLTTVPVDQEPRGFQTNTDYDGALGLDECGSTYDTQTPYYGKVSWKFKIDKNNDCSSPCLSTGFSWNLVADDQNAKDYEYPDEIKSLIETTSAGEVTGPIIDVLRGPRDAVNYQKLVRNGLTPMKNSTATSVVTIPGNPCLKGLKTDYQWGIKRRRKVPFKIFCNKPGVGRIEIDYRNNQNVKNWVIYWLKKPNRIVGGAYNPSTGELLRTVDGYFYTIVEEMAPIVPRVSGESGVYFSSFSGISFDKTSVQCVATKRVESSWRVDLDNPCGCDEVEVLTHYLIYPAISYTDPLYGTTETFPEQKLLNPEYPIPAPESPAARYGLSIGQELTTNRRQKIDCFEGTGEGRLHHPFLYGTDILPGMRKRSIKGLFNLSQSLECYHTSSEQSDSSKEYYYSVTDCDNCGRTSYFAVAYGHKHGSGSLSSGYEQNDSPSRAIYSQYRLLALDPDERYFTFYDAGAINTPDDIYVINYYRNGLSDKLDIGNFEINIAELSGSGKINIEHTGSKVQVSGSNPKILSFIDNSAIYDSMDVCSNDDPLYSYDIVSGSLLSGIHSSGQGTLSTNTNLTTYGKVYPNLGVIVLDGYKLNKSASFNSVTASNLNGDNSYKLFTAISGAAVMNKPMRARNVKFKTTNHYFVRIPSSLGNYSNNPTWVIESGAERGKIRNACFVDNPITYITTIGLYNSKGELLAVAKLSKPIKKSKENDVLIKVRLNW